MFFTFRLMKSILNRFPLFLGRKERLEEAPFDLEKKGRWRNLAVESGI
jgi:hypothetical protein